MNGVAIALSGAELVALPSGALWWPSARVLTVSDLHLGRPGRLARAGAALLPPYDIADTLARLAADIARASPGTVICLGDSFDDLEAAGELDIRALERLASLQAGRRWIWVEGNHDPGPVELAGSHLAQVVLPPLVFRHIALPGATGEISGHYHPKARLAGMSRPAFLVDAARVILPAYGTYTGGINARDPAIDRLMGPEARAILTGSAALEIPMPRGR